MLWVMSSATSLAHRIRGADTRRLTGTLAIGILRIRYDPRCFRFVCTSHSANVVGHCRLQTDEHIVKAGQAVNYTPFFTAHGFRFAALSIHPPTSQVRGLHVNATAADADTSYCFKWRPTLDTLTSHFLHTDVEAVGRLDIANVRAQGNGTFGTADILGRIHRATRYSQLSIT